MPVQEQDQPEDSPTVQDPAPTESEEKAQEETAQEETPHEETPQEEAPAPEEDEKPSEMQCELALLDKRYDKDGNKLYSRRRALEDDGKSKWWKLFALTETRHYDTRNKYKCTRLHVNPQSLKQLLQDVIVDFPYEPIDAQQAVAIDLPAYCLFFFRKELEETGMERFKDDETSAAYLKLLLEWIDKELEDAFTASQRFQTSELRPISYEHLWTIFKPGNLAFTRMLGQPRAFKIRGCWYETDNEPALAVRVQYIDYDGEKFGLCKTIVRVPQYTGNMRCADLNIMPFEFHPSYEQLRKQLLARGRRFKELAGQHFMYYDGVAVKTSMEDNKRYDRFHIDARVVIDCKNYFRFEPDYNYELEELDRTEVAKRQRTIKKWNEGADQAGETAYDELQENELIIANSVVRGFVFTHNRFLEMFVDNLKPIQWDEGCFDQVVLDAIPKQTIRALIETHTRRQHDAPNSGFDDIIQGKGKGLVMVLHGPPGVGKTLTAESVAELVHRPLYMVSAGDLGTDSASLETQLRHIMDITTTWGAVLLIDEADVFLERRSLHDMKRNAMVTVFLRVLECEFKTSSPKMAGRRMTDLNTH